ncbi:hypothetical protein GUJ93_ZPchr0013g37827 [Zizania palustris]|uniref:Uncharacterized protein n=1 Tax=Zizania palustris TaxID=103762 RepID=A0A8J5X110_ZIZPA|nr:hypothetical protein GUJ93_ZPchr0013g37827 [Zizania palustris]
MLRRLCCARSGRRQQAGQATGGGRREVALALLVGGADREGSGAAVGGGRAGSPDRAPAGGPPWPARPQNIGLGRPHALTDGDDVLQKHPLVL